MGQKASESEVNISERRLTDMPDILLQGKYMGQGATRLGSRVGYQKVCVGQRQSVVQDFENPIRVLVLIL